MRTRRRNSALLLASLIWLVFGCGVKAPPVPPDVKPPVIAALNYTLEEDRLTLTWQLADGSPVPSHYTVYQSRTSLTAQPCRGCPLVFKRLMTIRSTTEQGGTKTFAIEKGARYGFKIAATDGSGTEGPPSNTIIFDH